MRFRTAVLITTLVAAAATAADAVRTVAPIEFDYRVWESAGTTFSTFANGRKLDVQPPKTLSGPRWEKGKPNPPLSGAEAITLAVKTAKGIVKEHKHFAWGLTGATLVPWDSKAGYWYWKVTFEQRMTAEGHGYSGPTPTLVLIVLMDETVVKPTH